MTYSIVATDPVTGAMGAATATALAAVGGFVIHTRFGGGAIATQGLFTNWLFGEKGLEMLVKGMDASSVRDALVLEDDGHTQRQFIVCDTLGGTAGHTGDENLDIKIHFCDEGFALAGNMLHSMEIIDAMKNAFLKDPDLDFHIRLMNALGAGEKAGGDFRGTHSAAIKISYFDRPPLDLRVDWADQGCTDKLMEIYDKTQSRSFQEFIAWVPTIAEPTKKKSPTKLALALAPPLGAPPEI